MSKHKKRWGDRKDAKLVRGLDSMHVIVPYTCPNRTANEAVVVEEIDCTALEEYVAKLNSTNPDFKYTFFHVISAAIAKTIVLRPRMNRFYSGTKLYEKNDVVLTFVVKKQFTDDAHEAMAIIKCEKEGVSPLEDVYGKVKKFVTGVRVDGEKGGTTDIMDVLKYLPGWLLKFFFWVLKTLEKHGHYPAVLMKEDPYYASCFISNLGSIKMHADYHHLAEWGTNSFFVIIGEKKPTPVFNEDGTYQMKNVLKLGVTVDERIADGVYFAKTIKIIKKLLANPELLELPVETPVDID